MSDQYNSELCKLFYDSYTYYYISIYFFDEIIFCFIYFFQSKFLIYSFFRHGNIFWYFSILLIRASIFNISADSLNIFSSLLPHLLQNLKRTREVTNIWYFRIYKFFIFFTFLRLFLILTFLKPIHQKIF